MKHLLICLLLTISALGASAQLEQPVTWSYAAKKTGKNEAVLYLKATIEPGWHLYSQRVKPGGPFATSFSFIPSKSYSIMGTVIEPNPIVKEEKVFSMAVAYFENIVVFQQKVKLLEEKPFVIKGKLEYMVCNDDKCLPPSEMEFNVSVK